MLSSYPLHSGSQTRSNGGCLMAQKIMLIDDLDGTEGEETLLYTIDGQEYELDLSEKNADQFRTLLTPYMDKSRPVERQLVIPGKSTRRRTGTGGTRDDIAQVRVWAEAQGIPISPRGRIKKETLDRYDQEHTRA